MTEPRRVSLFRNGRNQAVRIPRDLELPGQEALLRRDGDRLVLEAAPATTLKDLIQSWGGERLPEAWPDVHDPKPEPFSLS
ncbi:MAG: AbrB/MazE/SpoVT family DNA-binding domain-containing protein [Hyphomonadaceae bacterium]|nr:AbrB/MazE/SpoVT family DNA-binding domain-containing protein [Hyphomonadaceae bacterium]